MINSIRYGFAANSSSTHSIIFLNSNELLQDKNYTSDFGWDYFIASSEQSKLQYLASTVFPKYQDLIGETAANDLMKLWFSVDFTDPNICSGVDHQSLLHLPINWDNQGFNVEFLMEFKDFLLNERISILGGNDNYDEDDEDYKTKQELLKRNSVLDFSFFQDCGYDIVARKDPLYNFWVLFNRKNGTKVRFNFDSEPFTGNENWLSSVPELVDLKITNYCSSDCSFCYQGSTEQGKHADYNRICRIIYMLAKNQVFEVAIGGGEPTTHPKFTRILDYCRTFGVVPNFTTKNTGWLKNQRFRDHVFNVVGAVAFSIENEHELKNLQENLSLYGIPSEKIQIQVIDTLLSEQSLEQILRICSENYYQVTILGFKDVGRGKLFSGFHFNNYDPIDLIMKLREEDVYVKVGVDTAFVNKHEDKLKNIVDDVYYSKTEGTHSCYIDAVEMLIGKSSYNCDLKPFSRETFLNDYHSFS